MGYLEMKTIRKHWKEAETESCRGNKEKKPYCYSKDREECETGYIWNISIKIYQGMLRLTAI